MANFSLTCDTSSFSRSLDSARKAMTEATRTISREGSTIDEVFAEVANISRGLAGNIGASMQRSAAEFSRAAAEMNKAAERMQRGIGESSQRAQSEVKQTGATVSKEANEMCSAFDKLKGAMGVAFAGFTTQQLLSQIISVRGEFQKLEVSFSTLLGSESKGKGMFKDITDFATSTPMMESALARAAQTMLSFNISSEKVMPLLRQMGDISMGDSQKLQSLALAFSQASSSGKLMGQDLLQMINAGFNPLVEISKKTGRSMTDLKDAMSKGEISIAMVEDAFKSATSEGGQFAGMLEKQSKTLVGAQSNLEGAIQKLTNAVGEKLEPMLVGAFNGGYDAINNLTETLENTYINFERIGRIIAEVAAVYGTYKAVSFAVLAVEKAKVPVMAMVNVAMRAAAIQGKTLTTQQALLAVATHGATSAFKAFGAAVKANWIGLAVTAVVALVAAIYELNQKETQEAKTEKALIKIRTDAAVKAEQEKQKVENLIKVAKDETIAKEKRLKAIKELNKIVPEYNAHLDHETGAYQANTAALDEYLKKLTKKYELEGAKEKLQQLGREKAELKAKMGETENDYKSGKIAKEYGQASIMASYGSPGAMIGATTRQRNADVKAIFDVRMKKLKEEYAAKEEFEKRLLKLFGSDIFSSEEQPQAPTPQETKTDKDAEKERIARLKAEAEYQEMLEKQAEKERRQRIDDEFATQQAVIDAMEDSSIKKQKQIQLDYEKQKEAIRRGAEDLIAANEAVAKEVWEKDPTNAKAREKGDIWYTSQARKKFKETNGLTGKEIDMFQKQGIANNANARAQMKKIEDEAAESFAEHITASMINDVDWSLAFEQLGVVLNESLRATLARLDKFVKGEDFAKLSTEQQRNVLQARSDVKAKIGDSNFNFGGVREALAKYAQITEQVREAEDARLALIKEQNKLQTALNKALLDGNKVEAERTQQLIEENKIKSESNDAKLQRLKSAQVTAEAEANDQLVSFKDSITDVANVVQGLASGKLSSLWNALGENLQGRIANSVGKLFSGKNGSDIADKAGDAISGALKVAGDSSGNIWGAIISAILSVLDIIAEKGLGELVSTLVNSISDAVSSIIRDLGSGALVKQIVEAVGNLLKDVGNALFSALSFGVFGNGNGKEVQKITERNTKAIEELTERIGDYTNSIKDDKVSLSASIDSYEAAVRAQKEVAARSNSTLQAQMAYHGDHHSNNYYANDAMIRQLYNSEVQNATKAGKDMEKSIAGLNDVYSMSPEQIAAIKTYMPKLWEYLTTVGKYDKSEYWDAVAEQAGKVDELTETLNEKLTGMSFDSIRDEFASMLKDLSTTSQDWADSFEDMLKEAVINGLMADNYTQQLADLRQKMADAIKGGTLADEAASLKAEYNRIKNEAMQDRNDLYAALGIQDTQDQQASQNGIQSITEDTANELIGRITAMQIAVETMRISDENSRAVMNVISNNITSISTLATVRNAMLSDIRDMHAVTNSYLEDIAKYQKGIFNEIDGRIQKIVKHTEKL